jgi:hypothetical protein
LEDAIETVDCLPRLQTLQDDSRRRKDRAGGIANAVEWLITCLYLNQAARLRSPICSDKLSPIRSHIRLFINHETEGCSSELDL